MFNFVVKRFRCSCKSSKQQILFDKFIQSLTRCRHFDKGENSKLTCIISLPSQKQYARFSDFSGSQLSGCLRRSYQREIQSQAIWFTGLSRIFYVGREVGEGGVGEEAETESRQ